MKDINLDEINHQYDEYIKELTLREKHLKIPVGFDFDEDTLLDLLDEVKSKEILNE